MKKNYLIALIIVVIIVMPFIFQTKEGRKVFKIENPTHIYLDLNNNGIFDETQPLVVSGFKYIDKNADYSKNPILKALTKEQKIFLEYLAKDYSYRLIKSRYVKHKDNDIFIKNKSYTDLMLNSNLVYSDDEETQKALVNQIN